MPHESALIATLAGGLSVALVFGYITTRLNLSPLVGYLLAGIVISPHTPGFVGDLGLAQQLAEVGVIFLMFGVGMHFSLGDLWSVRGVALIGAIVQIGVATALGMVLSQHWGWSLTAGLMFGLALSVASTVVLLRTFREDGTLQTVNGRIAVGWLIVEDLVCVFVLVLLPTLSGKPEVQTPLLTLLHLPANTLWASLLVATIEVVLLTALMLVVGRRVFPRILSWIDRTGSRELFTLAVFVMAVGVAYGSAAIFDVSFALGAFFAGIVLNGSALSKRITLKLQGFEDIFSVLFFVAIGMLLDPNILLQEPLRVIAVAAIVLLGKSIAAALIVLLLRRPLDTALTVSASLAQIGEFSFILCGMAVALNLMPSEGLSLVVAAAIISIVLNPLAFKAARAIGRRLEAAQIRVGD